MTRHLVSLILVITVFSSAVIFAQSSSAVNESQRHYEAALAALKVNNFDLALLEMERANVLTPRNPTILYSLASIQERKAILGAALKNVQLSLALGLTVPERTAAEAMVRRLSGPMGTTASGTTDPTSSLVRFRGSWSHGRRYSNGPHPKDASLIESSTSWRLIFDDPPVGNQMIGMLTLNYQWAHYAARTDRIEWTATAAALVRQVGDRYELDIRSYTCTAGDCDKFTAHAGATTEVEWLGLAEFRRRGVRDDDAVGLFRKEGIGGYDELARAAVEAQERSRAEQARAAGQAKQDEEQRLDQARLAATPAVCSELKSRVGELAGNWLLYSDSNILNTLSLRVEGSSVVGVEIEVRTYLDSSLKPPRQVVDRMTAQIRMEIDCSPSQLSYAAQTVSYECPNCSPAMEDAISRRRCCLRFSWQGGTLRFGPGGPGRDGSPVSRVR